MNIFVIALFLGLTVYLLEKPTALYLRFTYAVVGILLFGIGNAFYLTCHQGPGPRDGLMVGLCYRFHWKIGIVRTSIEVFVCLLGYLLGGVLGIGTLMFALGIGLFSGALNVFYRDSENFVDLILMMATWVSPVLYTWFSVRDVLDAHGWHWLWWVYEATPLTIAVELFHYGFWQPTLVDTAANPYLPNLGLWTGIALLISLGAVIFGEVSFRRMDPKFAQEL